MTRASSLFGALVLLAFGVGAGFWWGQRTPKQPDATGTSAAAPAGEAAEKAPRKLLYYRNPMGLPDTSPVPKKDPMGMDYVAVYEGEEPEAGSGQIRISVDKVQKLGVRSEPVVLRVLEKTISAAGRIEVDERRLYAIAPKFEGWVERLFVNATGEPVALGQPLFEVYSPELVSAQREYAIASQAVKALKDADAESQASMRRLAESSLTRLRNWDISDEQVQALAQSGEARRTLTFRSPVAGIVMEKKAIQGMRFMPGEALYQIADLSALWVIAEVFEQDIGAVRTGGRATVRINAYGDQKFEGRITYVYPTFKADTHTIPIRLEIANPRLLLRPAMHAQVEVPVGGTGKALTVPISAVIDSGTRQIVLVELGEGRFEPREVKLGIRNDQHVQVIEGVKEGERVVVSANFLIDAESNLKAAIGGFGQAAPAASGEAKGAIAGATATASRGPGVGHRADGTVKAVDAKSGSVSVAHGPVASLNWPSMTMDFKAANQALLAQLKPGAAIIFEFVERAPGEWVITRVAPAGGTAAAKAPAPAAAPQSAPAAHQH